jgi:hypothetical protein
MREDDHPTGEDDSEHTQNERWGSFEAGLESVVHPERQNHAEAMDDHGTGDQHDPPTGFP